MRPFHRSPHALAVTVTLLGLAAACSRHEGGVTNDPPNRCPETSPCVNPDDGAFESDDPNPNSSVQSPGASGGGGSGGSASTGGSGGTINVAAPESGNDADGTRAIEEADIIKIEDGRLYALSRYGGLSVIDVSVRDQLTMLGNHKVAATPFEMYVHDGIAMALYNGYADYSYDAETSTWTYYQSSYVIALDARDPEQIVEIGRFPVAGEISDSRIVGNVLYVAAFENGYCWGCATSPRTNVMSLDVSDLSAIRKVDELAFEEREESYSWKRSLMATDQRLYIAGPVWGPSEPVGSTIQVIDITDPGGDMVPGAAVEVDGQISSRWQMDEYGGNLRVISQPFTWRTDTLPTIQTFVIESSSSLVPLGSGTIMTPRPEQLQTVRFDGDRAYAITFQQTDPLFTIDLTDAAHPQQVGELEMPGWVYHMEPRGDRVLGLGFDQGNEEGGITVSLFDVSNLAAPTMLSRVNFGGDWGSLAEDQDRIHKAFNILDSQGLILVPFSGWSYDTGVDMCSYSSAYLSGVQLVDWANDALTLRGAAPSVGQARRGFIHDERLLTMSDERVESFDISDRSSPERSAALPIARLVSHTTSAGDHVMRVSQNWWTETAELDLTTLSDVEQPVGRATLELPELSQTGSCYSSSWLGEVYSSGSNAYLLYNTYSYDPDTSSSREAVNVLTVDASDPDAPVVAGNVELEIPSSYYYYGYYYGYGYGLVASGSNVVNVGSSLVISGRGQVYDPAQQRYVAAPSELKVVDLRSPTSPRIATATLDQSTAFTGLLASGTIVATSHHEPSPNGNGRVRFYLDRVDVTNPRSPVVFEKVNIPGSLVAYDAESARAITTDYQEVNLANVTYEDCYQRYGSYRFDAGSNVVIELGTRGTCTVIRQSLFLVAVEDGLATVIDRVELALGETVRATALGDDRLFVSVGTVNYYYGGYIDYYYGYSTFEDRTVPLLVLSGIRSGDFAAARLEVSAGDYWGNIPLVASGTRAALSTGFQGKLAVIDADDPRAPRVAREVDIAGWVQDLDVVGDTAVASLGYDGAQSISLAD